MLEPRESDLPALLLVLVVLPLVTYILLGKWSEAAKKKERISLLSQLAAEEALRAEAMAAATVIPLTLVPSSNNGIHVCARCFGPATTRCSRCKSVRYCSGKCQIIHWREVHKQECQQLGTNSRCSSPKPASNEKSIYERHFLDDNMNSNCFGYNINQPMDEKTPSDDIIRHSLRTGASATAACATVDTPGVSVMERRSIDKQASRKSNREMSKREDGAVLDSSDETSKTKATCSTSSDIFPSKEVSIRHKLRNGDSMLLEEEIPKKHIVNIPGGSSNGQPTSRSTVHESHKLQSQCESIFDSRTNFGMLSSLYSAKKETDVCDIEMDLLSDRQNKLKEGVTSNDETAELNCDSDMTSMKRSIKTKSASHSPRTKMYKSLKSIMKASREQSCSEMEMKGQIADESKVAKIRDTIPTQGSNGVANMGILKMIGLRKSSKLDRQEISEISDRHKKLKMLFPYEEFVKFFQCEVFDLSPRGLVNCGNSCYANAVLQCLTCTKPLTIYLLRRSHSKACTVKDWCLMCELEQHVMMLRESGGPLSPSRILLHMRSINCQIGDGSQEDAHEFLRLLVTSMQSICLEGLGGEDMVDPRLQETTFIQHTFGGRLRSKVKCLRCHHESECYENIMDLTLEIFGWVESLEDALTQFTTPEDLDGDNMYRCGRCAAYVRARKQLRIHQAPNILTIVLKRFQEGSYGKINKCITFPDMLDMIPFMTGTDDIPPLYMLYAVVVHLDTLNASFSGHYVSYVKDMHDNWFRIDDTEVQPVPMSHVMSEGAYILFYMRSCPRPTRAYPGKAAWNQAPGFAKHWTSKSLKSSRSSQSKSSCQFVGPEPSSGLRPETAIRFTDRTSNGIFRSANRPQMETCAESVSMDFSDATSSDWSIFTSSDEASFTTESTRDSVSTVDYTDTCSIDPISSIFNPMYAAKYPSHKTVSCSRFSSSKPQTRFVLEGKGLVSDSYLLTQPLDSVRWNGENLKQVSAPSIHALPSNSNCAACVKYESKPKDDLHRTSGHCKI